MKIFKKIKNLFKKEEAEKKEQTIGESIESYAANAKWDDISGELTINGSVHLPFTKQIWFGEPDLGLPIIESHNFGIDADEDVRYFTEKMMQPSKLPFGDFSEMKIAAQTIGLDLVQVEPPIEMTSGYLHFEEIKYADDSLNLKEKNPKLYYTNLYQNAEKTLFQMKKVKRANEKVVDKILQQENRNSLESFHKSIKHGK